MTLNHEIPSPELQTRPTEFKVGIYTPGGMLSNQEIESWNVQKTHGAVLTADGILNAVGIERRSIAEAPETTHDMASNAIQELVYNSGIPFTNPDLVLVSSSFPTGINHAGRLVNEWGMSPAIPYKDIHAACSGFVKGLVGLYKEGDRWMGADVLFAASEKYSPFVHDLRHGIDGDPALSQTIFSDGAVATQFRYGKDLKVLAGRNVEMFDKSDLIGMPIREDLVVGPADRVVADATLKTPEIFQKGSLILLNMGRAVPRLVRELADEAGLDSSDPIPTFLHQGSRRVIEDISAKLEPTDNDPRQFSVYQDLRDGNFSSVTIPRMLGKAHLQKGQRAILVGFGAGLFASGAVVEFG